MPKLTFKHDWNTILENTVLTRHQEETRLKNVHDTVMKYMGDSDPYAGINELYDSYDRGEEKAVSLHSSRGTKQAERGKNVLEFAIAGSGFRNFRTVHAHFTGEGEIVKDGVIVSVDDIKHKNRWTKRTKRWFRDLFTFRENSKVINRKYDEIVDEYSKDNGHGISKLEEEFQKKYGTRATTKGLEDKEMIFVKKDKEHPNKVRYNMPGPLSMNGIRDAGEYSIDNLSNYMLTGAQDYLNTVFEKYKEIEARAREVFRDTGDVKAADQIRKEIEPTVISLKGHSRGGVAAGLGAMKIKNWIKKEHPEFEKYVNFELVQYDPVPGYFSDSGYKHRVNLNEKDPAKIKEMEKQGLSPLGDKAETTVVYSMHVDHPLMFSPQSVQGAKRIIMTPTAHSVNLDQIDSTTNPGRRNVRAILEDEGEKHRGGYTDAKTGEVYRGSGLNELPAGIYVADESMRLIKMPSAKIAGKILDDVVKDARVQSSRHRRLHRLINEWFEKPPVKESEKEKLDVQALMGRPRSKSVTVSHSKKSLLANSTTLSTKSSAEKAPSKSK